MSATDPVRNVTRTSEDHPVLTDIDESLKRHAAYPPSPEVPYLTASLDWMPEGNAPAVRQATTKARDLVEAEIDEYEKRSPARASLREDVETVTERLGSLDSAAKGVYVVANSSIDILDVEPLGLPIETKVTVAPIPALKRLAQMVEDYPMYAILQVDQQLAQLSFVSEEMVPGTMSVESSDWPRKQASGGWSQRRYQARADERVQASAKRIAEEVRKALDETGVRRMILSASDVMRPALMDEFHQTVSDKIIGDIRIDIDAPFQEVLELSIPVKKEFERKRELEQVEEFKNALHSSGLGAGGAVDVLNALRNGQVRRLLMTRQYEQMGWMDYTMSIGGVGDPPATHPAGGKVEDMVAVPLEEEMIRQAVLQDAEIEIVKGSVGVDPTADVPAAGQDAPRNEAGTALDEFGGVAAVLRFAI